MKTNKKINGLFIALALGVAMVAAIPVLPGNIADAAILTPQEQARFQKILDEEIIPALKNGKSLHLRLSALNDLSLIGERLEYFEKPVLDELIGVLKGDDKQLANSALDATDIIVSKNESTARYALPRFAQMMASPETNSGLRANLSILVGDMALRFINLALDAQAVLQNTARVETDKNVLAEIAAQLRKIQDGADSSYVTVPEQLKP